MRREQAQIVRLLLVCAAYALGQTLSLGLGLAVLASLIPFALAAGVYVLTDDLGRARLGGGDAKYWRGRRIDDDRRGDRWN